MRAVMDPALSNRLAEVAKEAATSVGDMLRSAFRSSPEVAYKRDRHDPVTPFDNAAEKRIREVVLAGHPDSRIVGEEGGSVGTGGVDWYVDPIDGTANFARGLPSWCTSVAAVVGDHVVAGAVYDAMRDDLFSASAAGAFHNGSPIRSTGATSERYCTILTSYPSPRELARDPERAPQRLTTLIAEYQTLRRPGSAALNLAYIAAGWADVTLGVGVNPWDVTAGALLVTAAGGTFSGLRRIDDESNGPAWSAPGYLASVGAVDHDTSVAFSVFADSYRRVELT